MKIVIKIEKKHLYFLALFLLIVGVGIAIASTWDNSQSHDTLWTTAIKGKNVPTINVYDSLSLQPGQSLCLNGVCKSAWPTVSGAAPISIYTYDASTSIGRYAYSNGPASDCKSWVYLDSTNTLRQLIEYDCTDIAQPSVVYYSGVNCGGGAYVGMQTVIGGIGYARARKFVGDESLYYLTTPQTTTYKSYYVVGDPCTETAPTSVTGYVLSSATVTAPKCSTPGLSGGDGNCVLR